MNFQELIEKYTKLVAKQLYNIDDIKIIFVNNLRVRGLSVPAVSFLEPVGSFFYCGEKTIKYNSTTFEKCPKEIPSDIWEIIVHEITHNEIGMIRKPNGTPIFHSQEFHALLKVNLKKVSNLKKEFNKELRIIKKTMPMYQKV